MKTYYIYYYNSQKYSQNIIQTHAIIPPKIDYTLPTQMSINRPAHRPI